MTRPALNQGYLMIYSSAWSSLQTVPLDWKRIIHSWITPMFTKILLIRNNRLALLSCHHVMDRRPVYPFLEFVTGLCGKSQNHCTGNMMRWAVAKRLKKTFLWSTTHSAFKLNLTYILNTASFCSHMWITANKWLHYIHIVLLIINIQYRNKWKWYTR